MQFWPDETLWQAFFKKKKKKKKQVVYLFITNISGIWYIFWKTAWEMKMDLT